MAGGSYVDICFEFGVASGSFFVDGGVLWGTMELLNDSSTLVFHLTTKRNETKLRKIAKEFAHYSKNKMDKCVLAIDGWVCRTRCPNAKEVQFPISHQCHAVQSRVKLFQDYQ